MFRRFFCQCVVLQYVLCVCRVLQYSAHANFFCMSLDITGMHSLFLSLSLSFSIFLIENGILHSNQAAPGWDCSSSTENGKKEKQSTRFCWGFGSGSARIRLILPDPQILWLNFSLMIENFSNILILKSPK